MNNFNFHQVPGALEWEGVVRIVLRKWGAESASFILAPGLKLSFQHWFLD